jgi:hypothetical protein
MGWACITHMRDEKCITNFTWKIGKEAPIKKSGRIRWEENIIMDLKEIWHEGMDWVHLAQDRPSDGLFSRY